MNDPREFTCMDDSPFNNGWGYNSPEPIEEDTHYLDTIKWGVEIKWISYRNVVVEKALGGYSVLGKTVKSAEDVDEIIDEIKP